MRLLVLALIFGFAPVHAEESAFESTYDTQLTTLYRQTNSKGFSNFTNSTDLFFLGAGNLKFHADESWLFEARPELRGLMSPTQESDPRELVRVSVRSPTRLMGLETQIASNSRNDFILDFERLNIAHVTPSSEVYIGRKPVGLGVLKIMPVWNKLTKPLPFVSGLPFIFGSDSVGARYQSGALAYQAVGIGSRNMDSDSIALGEMAYFGEEIEIHGLVSHWWQHPVAGLAATKDFGGMTLRSEVFFISPVHFSGNDDELQAGIGGEYAFTEKCAVLSEFMYFSDGEASSLSYPLSLPSRFRPLRAQRYGTVNFNYQISSYWNTNLGTFANLVDGSQYLLARIKHSFSDHVDLEVGVNVPVGSDRSEFSARTFTFPNGAEIGAPLQIYGSLLASF